MTLGDKFIAVAMVITCLIGAGMSRGFRRGRKPKKAKEGEQT